MIPARAELIIETFRGQTVYGVRPLYPEQIELLNAWFYANNDQRKAAGYTLWSDFKEGKLVGVYRPKGQPVQYAVRMKAGIFP